MIWEEPGFFFGEEDFIEQMNTTGKAFREEHYVEGDFPGCDFRNIHFVRVDHPNPIGVIVISHGFCEFIRKYDELIYYFYQLGYSIYMPEHRGHGFSYRSVEDYDKVDVATFRDYVEDFKCFMDMVVRPASSGLPKILFAHSMGGAIAASYMEQYPDEFDAAILSSPMMEMALGRFPEWFVRLLAGFKQLRGHGSDYIIGSHGFDEIDIFEKSSALSKSRYEYVFDLRCKEKHYRTYGGTYNWIATCLRAQKKIVRQAGKITVPVLLFQAGLDTKVNARGQNRFCARNQNVKKVEYPLSKHEIFNATEEMREDYFKTVFSFLASVTENK